VDEIVGVRVWLPVAMLKHVIPQSGGVKTVDNGSSDDELGDVSGSSSIHGSSCMITNV
jgi:hypothetical protein